MNTITPSTMTAVTEEVPPPSSHCSPGRQGVGVGVGSPPVVSGGPANVEEARQKARKRTEIGASIRITTPAEVVLAQSGLAATTEHCTSFYVEEMTIFNRLLRRGEFDAAEWMCREKLLIAEDERTRVRWVKDFAVVKRAKGDAWAAFDLHASIAGAALRFEGVFRGKIEHGKARSFETVGLHRDALALYPVARDFFRRAGASLLTAHADTNHGRCLVEMNRPAEAHILFDRAEASADERLRGQIAESRALALLAEGRTDEALRTVAQAIAYFAGTDDECELQECLRTRALILR